MLSLVVFVIAAGGFLWIFRDGWLTSRWKQPKEAMPLSAISILKEKVPYYSQLSESDKQHFEFKILEFLLNCKITGVSTEVNEEDRLLIASSAIIPIFYFKEWRYENIDEVLLYPDSFNFKFETTGQHRDVLGMVGEGVMNGKMILSKRALHQGFSNETDKKNTAIHEFVHLIDKSDGLVDGVPSNLLDKQYVIPWLDMMNRKMDEIYGRKSDIDRYGGSSEIEFFAVASEYFFERPELLEKKHPELYAMLLEMFRPRQ